MTNFIINKKEYGMLWGVAKALFDAAFTSINCDHDAYRKAEEFQSKLFQLEWDDLVAPDDRAIYEDELTREELNMRMQLLAAIVYYI